MKKLILLVALLVPAAACASARAQVQPEAHPALEVPPVPPRHIAPLPVEPPALEPVAELPTEAMPTSPPRSRPNNREPNNNRTDPKAEAKQPETPPDPATPPVPAPVPPLRQGTVDGPELERQVRDTLERASKILASINPLGLNEERRTNYDYAKNFIKQSDDAIKASNLSLAKSLADRAETIAKSLAGGW
jgi:hypothetical protein